jgi:tetratricopeptide (TPR) repeat protein
VTARSPSAYDLCLRAGAFLEDPGDPQGADKALEQYARAVDIDPDFALAWAGESRALWKIWNRDKTQESIRRAEEAANHAIRLNPELLEARLARAQIYRTNSRYAESIRELKDVLRVNPSWTEALIHLAASYRDAGDSENAVATQLRAVELQPGYWRNWSQLGALYFRLARYDEAAAAFRQVIRLIPEKNHGYEQLGAVETKRGDYAAAMAAYQRLPSPPNTGAVASNMGAAYYFQGRFDEARRYFEQAVRLEPRNSSWLGCLADLHAREGKADSARAEYARGVDLINDQLHVDPKNVNLQLDRAVLLAKLGQCDASRTALTEVASQVSASDAEQALRIAKVNAVCRRGPEAIAGIRRALALGAAWPFVRQQDEFGWMADDPAFLALGGTKKN